MIDDQRRPRPTLNGWRIAGWGAAAALLALPAIAMRVSDDVAWSSGDFIVAAALLLMLGLAVEGAVRLRKDRAMAAGTLLAGLAAFLTAWLNGAVGIIGNEGEPINLGFYALLLAALFASIVAWFRPSVLKWIFAVVAAGQIALGFAALSMMPGHAVEWGLLGVFAALWGAAAFLFGKADGTATATRGR